MDAILADECIPYEAVTACRDVEIDILSVIELATGASDRRVLELAQSHDRVLVTLDADMGALARRGGAEACPGTVLLRVRPGGPNAFADLMRRVLESGPDLKGYYTLLHKDRIRQVPLAGAEPPEAEEPMQ